MNNGTLAGTEPAQPPEEVRDRRRAVFAAFRVVRRRVALQNATRRRRAVLITVALLTVAVLLYPAAWLVYHVYFDRSRVPDLEAFIQFEPPTTGVVRDVHGNVLIEVAHEYRRVVTYDEVPVILRQADPGRRGQEVLHPFRRRLPCPAAGDPEGGGALAG